MSDFESNLSIILQKLMRNKGLSISELARRTSIPQPTIHRIARGEHQRPHKKTLESLANYFKVSPDQLLGLDPIESISGYKAHMNQIPILNCNEVANWPCANSEINEYVIYQMHICANAYAMRMPDKSMEPLIAKNSLLIIDPEKQPEYRNLVVVQLNNHDKILVRQLIKDASNCYIRPLSQDFDHFDMVMLPNVNCIKGVVIEARLNCEGL